MNARSMIVLAALLAAGVAAAAEKKADDKMVCVPATEGRAWECGTPDNPPQPKPVEKRRVASEPPPFLADPDRARRLSPEPAHVEAVAPPEPTAEERAAAARAEAERERRDTERAEAARAELLRQENARAESERAEAAKREVERVAAEQAETTKREAERAEAQRAEARQAEAQQAEAQQREAERVEAERVAAAKAEAERAAAAQRAAEAAKAAPAPVALAAPIGGRTEFLALPAGEFTLQLAHGADNAGFPALVAALGLDPRETYQMKIGGTWLLLWSHFPDAASAEAARARLPAVTGVKSNWPRRIQLLQSDLKQ